MVAVVGLSLMAVIPDGTTVRLAVPVMPCASTVIVVVPALAPVATPLVSPMVATPVVLDGLFYCGLRLIPVAEPRVSAELRSAGHGRLKTSSWMAELRSNFRFLISDS